MDHCYNQFNFSVATGKTFSTASGNFAPWVSGTNNNWVVQSGLDTSDFTIQGFKNINLYGIKLQGSVQCPISSNHGIVEDYSFNLKLAAQTPSISGVFTTNNWNATLYENEVRLGKYQNVIMFGEPLRSLSQIRLSYFSAQGYSNESLLNIRLDLIVQFYFLFKYEGEDEEFAFL
jgi:hypothetical protein